MRTFDDIIPPSRRGEGAQGDSSFSPPPPPPRRPLPSARPKSRFPYTIALVALVVVALSAGVVIYFKGAKIVITPSVASIPVESSMTAGPTGEIPFTLLSAKKSASNSLPSTGTKQATGTAEGSFTIYNTQSKPQTLVANTRFATPAGLIYRIHKSVTVPAGTNDAPGTVSTNLYADQPGATYNIGPSSFTVPGLAGTAQASAVYGRSMAAIMGGSSGTIPVVDPSAEAATVTALEASLAKDLSAGLDVPAGYTLLPGAATTTYHELPPVASQTAGKADIVIEALVTGVAIPSNALASAIASSSMSGAGVTLGAGTNLSMTPTSAFPTSNNDSFTFTLSGTAMLVSKIDRNEIATAVAGKTRSEAQTALASYAAVKRAVVTFRPFWKNTFPEDPSAITVVTLDPKAP